MVEKNYTSLSNESLAEEYIKHQNDPSGWTKSTNDPNPYDK